MTITATATPVPMPDPQRLAATIRVYCRTFSATKKHIARPDEAWKTLCGRMIAFFADGDWKDQIDQMRPCETCERAADSHGLPQAALRDGDPIDFDKVEYNDELRFATADNDSASGLAWRTGVVSRITARTITVRITAGTVSTGGNLTALLRRDDWSDRAVTLEHRVPGGRFGFPLHGPVATRWQMNGAVGTDTPVGEVTGHGFTVNTGEPYIRVRMTEDGRTFTHDYQLAQLVRVERDENGIPRTL
ncbi:hypothetical protein ACIHFD_49850 [Nonomuraea sp. NPDC051941]|uniref:hypothetical protein n=1 Tax=Nonomuraea sp. NPDC051941 TaxID=3364373 RepID=UPI0037C7999E